MFRFFPPRMKVTPLSAQAERDRIQAEKEAEEERLAEEKRKKEQAEYEEWKVTNSSRMLSELYRPGFDFRFAASASGRFNRSIHIYVCR